MCRNIKQLRNPTQQLASDEQVTAAALQYVRKVSGYRKPSKRNQVAFDQAVTEISAATRRLLAQLSDHPLETQEIVNPSSSPVI